MWSKLPRRWNSGDSGELKEVWENLMSSPTNQPRKSAQYTKLARILPHGDLFLKSGYEDDQPQRVFNKPSDFDELMSYARLKAGIRMVDPCSGSNTFVNTAKRGYRALIPFSNDIDRSLKSDYHYDVTQPCELDELVRRTKAEIAVTSPSFNMADIVLPMLCCRSVSIHI